MKKIAQNTSLVPQTVAESYKDSKRICMFVYNNFTNDSRVEREAESLNQAGYQVTVLALLDNQTAPEEERVSVRVIRVQGDPLYKPFLSWLVSLKTDVTSLLRSVIKDAIASGTKSYSEKHPSAPKKLKNLIMPFHRQFCFISFYRSVYKATARKGYDIYHAHDLNTLPVAYLVAKRDKAKLVYDSHELYVERNKLHPSTRLWKFLLRRLESFLVKRADAVLTVNETLAEVMAKRYRISRPEVVMNTPARLNESKLLTKTNSTLRNTLGLSPKFEVLLYVGRITFNRGLEQLIMSLGYLEDCCLVCMGGGDEKYKEGLLSLAKETGVDQRFFFFGPVPSEKVVDIAGGADLGIAAIGNSCLSYYYCSPNKLFEYMNAGIPVIASAFPELEKVVLRHKIGLTFDPSNPQDIARAARQVLKDPKTRKQMRQNALKAAKFYNWDNESEKLLQIYALLSSPCP
jgi:glycosyltransferase involved in cell wall biosynthesis